MAIESDPLYLKVSEALTGFRMRYYERIKQQEERLKACKMYTVIQSKRVQELKINEELESRLAELMKRSTDLDHICSTFSSGLTISDRDQQRLDKAKQMCEIGKKITGVRFDYSADQSVVKGYIKSEIKRTLTPFEFKADSGVCEALWSMIQDTHEKENVMPN